MSKIDINSQTRSTFQRDSVEAPFGGFICKLTDKTDKRVLFVERCYWYLAPRPGKGKNAVWIVRQDFRWGRRGKKVRQPSTNKKWQSFLDKSGLPIER